MSKLTLVLVVLMTACGGQSMEPPRGGSAGSPAVSEGGAGGEPVSSGGSAGSPVVHGDGLPGACCASDYDCASGHCAASESGCVDENLNGLKGPTHACE